ncbi:hypothetical protein CYY_009752 [Polysphondylium violaceum]|uniref:Uncharacterized protein n=1 Tax=Polysphondylium violaceum TaxID=133409 RepID=A0A8J4PL95_9MYCE|nr:hypothetical protein CYY_009752 [Polysphondylium violaceum]
MYSGHGTCNQQLNCDCSKDWESSDCSLPNNDGTVIPDLNVNPNDTSSTIVIFINFFNQHNTNIKHCTTRSNNKVVVDPNFGVLITVDPDQENKCKKKYATWKIAMVSVFGVAGVGLAVTTVMLVKSENLLKNSRQS